MAKGLTVDAALKVASERRAVADELVADELGRPLMDHLLDTNTEPFATDRDLVDAIREYFAVDMIEGYRALVNNAIERRREHSEWSEKFLADVRASSDA